MIRYAMKQDDARKLDHATLEAMRIRASPRRSQPHNRNQRATAVLQVALTY
jgi:hypothetical protein